VALIEHPTNPLREQTIGAAIEVHRHDALIVETKSIDGLLPIHSAQLLIYMRLMDISSGLLIKFNVNTLRQGIRRKLL
jgi:GxxExxY protein